MSTPTVSSMRTKLSQSPKVLRQWITYMAEYGYFNEFKPINYPDFIYNYMSAYIFDIKVSLHLHTMLKFEILLKTKSKLVKTINIHSLFIPDENKQTKCLASKYISMCLRTMKYFKYNINIVNGNKFDIELSRPTKTVDIIVTPFEIKRYSKLLSTLKK